MSISLVKMDRASNATYRWSWGELERVRVVRIDHDNGLAYVKWPASVRTVTVPQVDPFTGERMPGWVDVARLELDPMNATQHLDIRGCVRGPGALGQW